MQGSTPFENLAIDAKALRTCIDVLQRCRVRAHDLSRSYSATQDPFSCQGDARCADKGMLLLVADCKPFAIPPPRPHQSRSPFALQRLRTRIGRRP